MDNTVFQYTPAFKGARQDYLKQHYEVTSGDADLLALNELDLLRARSRDLLRNNETAYSAQQKFVEAMGAVTVKWSKKDGSHDTETQALWDAWTGDCNSDGYGDFNTLQTVLNRERFATGEAIIRMVIQGGQLKLQQIGAEYLDIRYMGENIADGKTRYGITFKQDKPVIYWFLPDNYFGIRTATDTNRVPVRADSVIHVFQRLSAGQWRGLPELTSILLTLYDTQDLIDSTIEKQKNAQAISWVIEQANALSMNPIGQPIKLGKTNKSDPDQKLTFKSIGNNVYYLNQGERINFHQAQDIGNNLGIMITKQLQRACSAVGVPYHQVTGDTMNLDFSSIRAILVDFKIRIQYQHHLINIPLCFKPIAKRWRDIESIRNKFVNDSIPSFQLPRFYGVDDYKDAKADIEEVAAGLSTLSSKLEERHLSFEDIAADRERIKELGIESLIPTPPPVAPAVAVADNNI